MHLVKGKVGATIMDVCHQTNFPFLFNIVKIDFNEGTVKTRW